MTPTVQLHLGDCLDILRGMPDGSVDAVVTDPPYCSGGYLEAQKNTKAQGLRGATINSPNFKWFSNDAMSTAGLAWLLRSVMIECRRVLKPNRSALIFTDWRMMLNIAPVIESAGVRLRNMIVWDKGNAGLGVGFKPAHEIVMEFANGTTKYQTLTGQNVLRHKRVAPRSKHHSAEKPVTLIAELLSVIAPSGGTILDPFMGSGTTGVACVQSGRNFIGMELDPGNVKIAESRIAAAQQARTELLIPA